MTWQEYAEDGLQKLSLAMNAFASVDIESLSRKVVLPVDDCLPFNTVPWDCQNAYCTVRSHFFNPVLFICFTAIALVRPLESTWRVGKQLKNSCRPAFGLARFPKILSPFRGEGSLSSATRLTCSALGSSDGASTRRSTIKALPACYSSLFLGFRK